MNDIIPKKVLFLSTVDSHIYNFHLPFMNLLKNKGFIVEIGALNTGFKDKIEKRGFKFYNIPFSKNPLSIKNLLSFFIIINLLIKNKYVLIHTHTPISSFIVRIAAKICKIENVIYTAHGFHFHEYGNKFKNYFYLKLEKFVGKYTKILITINNYDYEMALKYNIVPKDRLFLIKGVGIDAEFFNPNLIKSSVFKNYKELLKIKEDDFIIINISELKKDKNLFDLLKIINGIKKLNYKFKCLIVGDGPLKNKLNRMIKNLNLESNVILLGYREDVRELISISDIFVTTSIREGLSRSVMEAMSMEKPIVAYNIRGIRELVENNKTGFLIPYRNINLFIEKIEYFIKNPLERKRYGKEGRKKIQNEFKLDLILKNMEYIYNRLLLDKFDS